MKRLTISPCTLITNNSKLHPIQITIITRSMLTSIKHGTISNEIAKESFLKFCNHFNKIPYYDLHKDPLVIQFLNDTINKENYLCNRAFQLALEVSYSKRGFNRKEVLLQFDKYFSFRTALDRYDTISDIDQSTLFTALQSKIVKDLYPKWNIIINQSPPSDVPTKNLSPMLENMLEYNKSLTGNRFPDVSIEGISYDYKFSKDIYNTKNQIYLMPESPKAFNDFSKHLFQLSHYLENNKNLPTEFTVIMSAKLNKVSLDFFHAFDTKTKCEIINDWNTFSIKLGEQRPIGTGTPIFIITNKPYIPDPSLLKQIEKINISEGHLDYVKSKTVLDAIVGNYPKRLQDSIYNATKGSLGHLFNNDDIVD